MRLFLSLVIALTASLSFGQNQNYVPNELIMQLEPNVNPNTFIRKFETQENIGVLEFSELSDIVNIYHLKLDGEPNDLDRVISIFNNYREVRIIQKNHYVTNRETIPTDAFFDTQWHLKNTGVDGGDVDADIDATDAWDVTTGGLTTHNDTIVVCVIEGSGVDISHVDLQENIWRNHAEIPDDGIDNDGNGYVDDYLGWNVQSEDDLVGSGSHGTRVCGMIGAKGNNGVGISGVNWDVKMMIVKGQSASDEASVIAAYSYPLKMRKMYNESYGAEGAFVVATNASWGLDGGTPEDSPLWCAMYDSLGVQGVISVGATTNHNLNVEESGDLPTNCTSEYFIGVTMTNNTDVRAGSGYGTTSVDLGAPGSSVRLTAPGDSYTTSGGTSFAAPCVTGAVALAYSAPCPEFISFVKYDPAGAALQMRQYIFDGVDPIVSLSSEVATGGRLNVNNSIGLMMAECDEDACISPFNIRTGVVSDTSAEIIWDGFTTDYILTIQPAGGVATDIPVIGGTTLNFDTLTPCTEYTITIRSDCEGEGLSDYSFPFVFTSDGCCKNPVLANPDKTDESLTISWPDILYATEYNFRYSITGEESWTELTDVTSPLTIEDLESCTEYDVQIYTVCDDSTRGYSDSYVFRTLGCGVCTELEYCPVIGANDNLEWIDSLKVNDFSHATGADNGWLKSDQIITALTPGETYNFRVRPGFTGGSFTERYSVYIDFDQNGVFDIPEDRVIDDYSVLGAMSQNITIPPGASIGVTKLRIGMSALSEPVPCPIDSFFGEYEDYCVYIGPQASLPEENLAISIYPNPANNQLFVKSDIVVDQILLYSNDGKLIMNISDYNGEAINIEHLSDGIYIIQIETEIGVSTHKFVKQ